MNTDVLHRFREGLASEAFTLTQIAEATDIPLATLSDMKSESWRPKVFDRLDKLEAWLTANAPEGRTSESAE